MNPAAQLAQARQNSRFLNQSVANPFAGLLPGNPGLNGPTIQRQQLLRPFPQFTNVFEGQESVGKIWYDSFQLSVEKRYSQGLVIVGAYTLSKNIEAVGFLNDQDAQPTRNLTGSDRTHRFVVSGVYQLPVGRGKRFAHDAGRAAYLIVGGWEYNWIGAYQSGVPIDLNVGVDFIGNPIIGNQSFDNWFNTCVQQPNGSSRQPNAARNGFDPCTKPAWSLRGPNTLRTIPFRSGQIRNPWRPQWDMSLNKASHYRDGERAVPLRSF